eukprot:CAMPEP_0181232276 /NCGR_PEP_ID=MMETSP1096-20121128/35632_1 /TAXON_ID=156174 ORGANISM="Chrysochromulina ericina, Strain CCMP281" /NCGR_SAMPLE_ID=MMETSP1096 /ASSEMBLY_ACC=CAM_ASM_000453 /LENGTH=47 /DNA_ID= /DNA_START= /DNA_END= /DNA_ORIENTATION=
MNQSSHDAAVSLEEEDTAGEEHARQPVRPEAGPLHTCMILVLFSLTE